MGSESRALPVLLETPGGSPSVHAAYKLVARQMRLLRGEVSQNRFVHGVDEGRSLSSVFCGSEDTHPLGTSMHGARLVGRKRLLFCSQSWLPIWADPWFSAPGSQFRRLLWAFGQP